LRFVTYQSNNSAYGQNFSYQNLLDTQLVAVSTTAVYDLYDSVRIRRIRMWGFQAAAGGSCTVTLSCPSGNAGLNGDTRTVSDTGIGFDPAFVSFVPDRRSAQAMWQTSSSTVAFRVGVNTPLSTNGSQIMIDLDLEFRNVESLSPNGATAGASLVVGQWYYRGLDGLPFASTGWIPQGVERIA
jgi:hypothetical protein